MKRFLVPLLACWIVVCHNSDSSKEKAIGLITDSAMVVSAHPLATKIGVEILRKGGNAVDASIAVQFALAIVFPEAGNIGGGGFMLLRTKDGNVASLDYREKAPAGGGGEVCDHHAALGLRPDCGRSARPISSPTAKTAMR